jgi:hypothetical protein
VRLSGQGYIAGFLREAGRRHGDAPARSNLGPGSGGAVIPYPVSCALAGKFSPFINRRDPKAASASDGSIQNACPPAATCGGDGKFNPDRLHHGGAVCLLRPAPVGPTSGRFTGEVKFSLDEAVPTGTGGSVNKKLSAVRLRIASLEATTRWQVCNCRSGSWNGQESELGEIR